MINSVIIPIFNNLFSFCFFYYFFNFYINLYIYFFFRYNPSFYYCYLLY
jgi:hypothetical protein